MLITLSIVVPTRNDEENLFFTLDSISKNFDSSFQIVVIDGGNQSITWEVINKFNFNKNNIKYFRDKALGVFPAQNLGIQEADGEWVMVLNSGDLLTINANSFLNNKFLGNSKEKIIVFAQQTYSINDVFDYVFTPTKNSVWPHQSILVKKEVYAEYGGYNENMKTCAEQLYFAKLRKIVPFKIEPFILTSYKIGGISTSVNYQISKDIYQVNRALGKNRFKSFINAFISPNLRVFVQLFISEKQVGIIKKKLFNYYK